MYAKGKGAAVPSDNQARRGSVCMAGCWIFA
uniref:Uncharacterized protein n=1 Tax=Oryzias sinensis TaxID=183150 RepID=A0A8C7WSN1_9TELE